jgi:hypothetical protein
MAFIAVAGGALFGGGAFGSLAFNAVLGLGMMGLSWWLQSQKHTSGPRKEDLEVSDQPIGTPVPLHYGTNAFFATAIWIKDNKLIEKARTERAGKGGPKITTYSYYVTGAWAIADNLQTAFSKLWMNDKVIFNNTNDGAEVIQIEGLNYEFYRGTLTQLPDPVMEASLGVGQTPAYRGLCYIVIPQLRFQMIQNSTTGPIVGPGTYPGHTINADGTVDLGNELYHYTLDGSGNFRKFDLTTGDLLAGPTLPPNPLASEVVICDRHNRLYVPELSNPFGPPYRGPLGIFDANTLQRIGQFESRLTNTSPVITSSLGPDNSETILFGGATTDPGGPNWMLAIDVDPNTGLQTTHEILTSNLIQSGLSGYYRGVFWGIPRIVAGPTITIAKFPELTAFEYTTYNLGADGYGGHIHAFGYYPDEDVIVVVGLDDPIPSSIMRINKYDASSISKLQYPELISSTTVDFSPGGVGSIPAKAQLQSQQNFAEGYVTWGADASDPGFIIFNLATMTYENCVGSGLGQFSGGRYMPTKGAFMGLLGGPIYSGPKYVQCAYTPDAKVSIKEIFDDWNPRVGMPAGRSDTDDLAAEYIYGYTWKSNSSIGEGFADIMNVWGIDIADLGDKYKFLLRGSQTPITIDPDDLGADEGDEPSETDLRIELAEGYEVPKTMHLKHWDPFAEFETSIQESFRHSAVVSSRDIVEVSTRMVLEPDVAAGKLADLFKATWRARVTYPEVKLPPKYRQYAPGDVFQVTYDGLLHEFMVDEITFDDSVITVKGTSEDVSAWGQTSSGQSTQVEIKQVAGLSLPKLHLLDMNAIRDDDWSFEHYLAHHAKTPELAYSGVAVQKGITAEQLGDWLAFNNPVAFGNVLTTPNDIPYPELTDTGSQLRVYINPAVGFTPVAAASVEALWEDFNLNPALLLVTADDGTVECEILQYASVVEETTDVWLFTDLMRGRRGTEHLITKSVNAVYMLFPSTTNMYREGVLSEVGSTRYYQAVSYGGVIPSNNPIATFVNNSKALRPYEPWSLVGARPGTDLVADWWRRVSIGGSWKEGLEKPLEYTQEEYNVNIWTDDTKTTFLRLANVVGASTYTYTLTNYNADAAASESIVPAVYVEVTQVGDDYGDGVPAKGTI